MVATQSASSIPMLRAVPAITAVPLAAQPGLIAISEFTLRIDEVTWAVAAEHGGLVLNVLQAADVEVANEDLDGRLVLDAAVAAAAALDDDDEETDPFQPWFQARPLRCEQAGADRTSLSVFVRSSSRMPARLTFSPHPADPPNKLVFTALRQTQVVLDVGPF